MQKKKSLVQQTADELYRLIVDENEFKLHANDLL